MASIESEKFCGYCLHKKQTGWKTTDDYFDIELIYSDMLYFFLGLNNCPVLPKYLCEDCESNLVHAYLFKKKCIESIQKLYNLQIDIESGTAENKCLNESSKLDQSEIASKNDEVEFVMEDDRCCLKTDDEINNVQEIDDLENLADQSEELDTVQEDPLLHSDYENDDTKKIKYSSYIENRESHVHEKESERNSCGADDSEFITESISSINKQYSCLKCNMHFDSRETYSCHYRKIHRKKRYQFECSVCNAEFSSKHEYNDHNRRFHSKKDLGMFKCLTCNIEFHTKREYDNHYAKMHRKKDLCQQCGKLVLSSNIGEHLQTHTYPKQHLCRECGKSFTLLSNLRQHERIHADDRRYNCDYCGEKFIHWSSRRCHIRIYHTDEKIFKCTLCEKKYAVRSHLLEHIKTHTGETPYECTICSKKFRKKLYLKNHMVTHTKEKNEICVVCNKAFGIRKTLRIHMKIHKGERNYVCPICLKSFTQAHVLRTHMKTHPDCKIPPLGTVLSVNKPIESKNFELESD